MQRNSTIAEKCNNYPNTGEPKSRSPSSSVQWDIFWLMINVYVSQLSVRFVGRANGKLGRNENLPVSVN